MAKIKPQVQALVNEYLQCLHSKEVFDEKLKSAKQKLLDYSLANKKKTLYTQTGSVTVSVKKRTAFPKYNQLGRKELEAVVKAAGYWDKALSFDVIKLAEAYDDGQLPEKLESQLAPFSRPDQQIRIFVNEFSVKPPSQTSL